MYKKLKKLAAITIISILLVSLNIGLTALAQGNEETTESGVGVGVNPGPSVLPPSTSEKEAAATKESVDLFKELQNIPECIDIPEGEETSRTYRYVITIIEEPLDYTQVNIRKEMEAGKKFISSVCFRSTLTTIVTKADGNKAEETVQKLGTECKDELAFLAKSENLATYYHCTPVQVLLSKGGTTLIEGYISIIYRWGASIVGIIAVLVIVISGIQISVSGGDSEAITQAKSRILKSIAGIVVLFLSGIILYTINPTFFVQ